MSKLNGKFYFYFLLIIALFTSASTFANQLSSIAVKNIEGTLEIRAANYLDKKSNRHHSEAIEYALKVNDNVIYSLVFTDEVPANLKTGQHINIREGYLKNILDEDGKQILMTSSKKLMIISEVPVTAIPTAFGRQKVLVMLVNFQNQPTNQPWSINTVRNTVFSTINNMFYDFSYKQTIVVGDVVGWYTLAMNSNVSCSSISNTLPTLAKRAAAAAGVDLSLYTRYVYMFPKNTNCTWAGLGTIGGNPSNAWLNGVNNAAVTAHELGHNLGLYHSHSLECTNSSNEGTCTRVEYGDYADTMGYTYLYEGTHFNAPQKERLGWLNYTTSPPIKTVTSSGTYTIDAMELSNTSVKALKVVKRINSNNSKEYYYLEFRQGLGFDRKLASCTDCDFTKGVLVHQSNSVNGNKSDMLDMSPLDNNKNKLVTLLPGKKFRDAQAPNGGVTIYVESISPAGAVVKITFGNN